MFHSVLFQDADAPEAIDMDAKTDVAESNHLVAVVDNDLKI